MVWNRGVSFGILQFMSSELIIFLIISMLIFLLCCACKNVDNELIFWPAILIVGGACGNLLDRLLFGAVFDFIDFHWKNVHWPAFNVADICVSISAVFLLIYFIFSNYEKKIN